MKPENVLGLKADVAATELQENGYEVQMITTKPPKDKLQASNNRVVRCIIKGKTAFITVAAFCTQINTNLSACNGIVVQTEEK